MKNYWFEDDEYAKILDELVIVCVDTLIYNKDLGIYLGLRNKLPIFDWWIFGGRMRANETFQQAAVRGLIRETGIDPVNRPQHVGYFDLVWEQRAEQPQSNGCHVLLNAMRCEITDEEAQKIKAIGNDHREGRWFKKDEILTQDFHHTIRDVVLRSGVLSIIS